MTVTQADLITFRRDLHRIPELALHEYKTHDYLYKQVKSWQSDFVTIRQVPELPTALLVRIAGRAPKRTIGYRADIDGLPITEMTQLPFASMHEGIMHACGHDFHMSLALGLLAHYSQNQPIDNMVFFFQPAEEAQSGGKLAWDLQLFEDEWRPDEFYALHVQPALSAGVISTRPGTLFAGTAELHVDIIGSGGHAAYPHLTKDPIVISAQFINQLQTIVSRNVDPIAGGVVTIGSIHGGEVNNVIPDVVNLSGTVRSLTANGLHQMMTRIQALADGLAQSYDVTINVSLESGSYLPVENNPALTENFLNYLAKTKRDFVPAQAAMTGEDFGYLLHHLPGMMFWLGVDDEHGLHNAQLSPNEAALWPAYETIRDFLDDRMQQR
jgi:N-acetyldiaminopimelate deacetylase